VLDQWDQWLSSLGRSQRRILRSPVSRTETFQKLLPGSLQNTPGISVSVKVVERQLGRTEASIMADARRPSDVRMPVLPRPCEVGGVRVPRTIGHMGMTAADVPLFLELKRIFPILSGWVVLQERDQIDSDARDLSWRRLECLEESRYDLAQSVLLLNLSGAVPSRILVDAASYGVPCVGSAGIDEQLALWPELIASDYRDALRICRGLLTDASLMQRMSDQARDACRQRYSPDEKDSAVWLRQLHARQLTAAAMGVAG